MKYHCHSHSLRPLTAASLPEAARQFATRIARGHFGKGARVARLTPRTRSPQFTQYEAWLEPRTGAGGKKEFFTVAI